MKRLTRSDRENRGTWRRRTALSLLAGVTLFLGPSFGCGGAKPEPTGLRVAVIGLDGATFDLLDPWFAEGLLPNLATLRTSAFSATMESVIPALSAPAWTSAVTGVNPGKHGVFDFELLNRDEFITEPATSLDREAKAVWEYLTDSHRRSVVISIPLTSPPDSIDGLMISGFPHLRPTGYTWPPELENQLRAYRLDKYGEYLPPDGEDAFLANLNATREARYRTAIDFFRNEEWELFWTVFMGSDKIQHFYWQFMDPEGRDVDPVLRERYQHAIRDHWIRVDEIVGEFLAARDENTVLLVVSDHGFVPVTRELPLLRWLWDEGYCSTNPKKSRVLYFPHLGGRLTINTKGAFDDGVVSPGEEYDALRDELREKLLAIRDPDNGKQVVKNVHFRDEVYSGRFMESAPDILIEGERGYLFGRGAPFQGGPLFKTPSFTFSGYHDRRGVLFATGPHVKPGRAETPVSLLDLAPTVLGLLGEVIPRDLDGAMMRAPFTPAIDSIAPPRIAKRAIKRDVPASKRREEKEGLKALPY
ncbi:MAG: hypothetical protein HKN20_09300, partial [Gemmatimonadetes bacterium]|nr:hypothetical protein [Gemmatimonadota bacterium]